MKRGAAAPGAADVPRAPAREAAPRPRTYGYNDPELVNPPKRWTAGRWFALFFALLFIAGVWLALVEETPGRALDSRKAAAGLVLLLVFLGPCAAPISRLRASELAARAQKTRFRAEIDGLPGRSVVFVRYSASHDRDRSLIENDGDLGREKTWLVYDRGADNARLRAIAPDRTPFLYDEALDALIRLDRPLSSEEERVVGASGARITVSRTEGRPVPPDSGRSRAREDSPSATR